MDNLKKALEEALVENPNDLATHSAYADHLMEQNDPRGEFIQVQLALEDPERTTEARSQLRKREAELFEEYGQAWLGDLARFFSGDWSGPDNPYHFQFARGWLDFVRVLPAPDAILAALAYCPHARLLRRLEVVYDMRYHPWEFEEFTEGPIAALQGGERNNELYEEARVLPPLLSSTHITNLRVFKVGYSDDEDRLCHSTMVGPFEMWNAEQMVELLDKNPRLDELYLNSSLPNIRQFFSSPSLKHLRVLQYYYGHSYYDPPETQSEAYPLSALAENPHLQQLTTLRLHPGRDSVIALGELDALLRSPNLPNLTHLQIHMTTFGDDGCRSILETGALKWLKVLDIGYGNMTDEGARLLAASPDLQNLELLDVSRNSLTSQGIAALQATGIEVVAQLQHDADDQNYLYEVDAE